MRVRVWSGMAVLTAASLMLLAGPALAVSDESVGEPPGLQDRETHLTLLTTHESDCSEIGVLRAVLFDGAQALVPTRYGVRVTNTVEPRLAQFMMSDYVCEGVSVDGQTYAPRTQISLSATSLATRDGAAVTGSYYLNSIATDNPLLAARYQQVGLPATFARDLTGVVSGGGGTPFTIAVSVPAPNAHTVTSVAPVEPVPVPTQGGPRLYYDGAAGEVVLTFDNELLGVAPAVLTADYRNHQTLAPMIALPRLLQIPGVTFATGSVRGTWSSTVARID